MSADLRSLLSRIKKLRSFMSCLNSAPGICRRLPLRKKEKINKGDFQNYRHAISIAIDLALAFTIEANPFSIYKSYHLLWFSVTNFFCQKADDHVIFFAIYSFSLQKQNRYNHVHIKYALFYFFFCSLPQRIQLVHASWIKCLFLDE